MAGFAAAGADISLMMKAEMELTQDRLKETQSKYEHVCEELREAKLTVEALTSQIDTLSAGDQPLVEAIQDLEKRLAAETQEKEQLAAQLVEMKGAAMAELARLKESVSELVSKNKEAALIHEDQLRSIRESHRKDFEQLQRKIAVGKVALEDHRAITELGASTSAKARGGGAAAEMLALADDNAAAARGALVPAARQGPWYDDATVPVQEVRVIVERLRACLVTPGSLDMLKLGSFLPPNELLAQLIAWCLEYRGNRGVVYDAGTLSVCLSLIANEVSLGARRSYDLILLRNTTRLAHLLFDTHVQQHGLDLDLALARSTPAEFQRPSLKALLVDVMARIEDKTVRINLLRLMSRALCHARVPELMAGPDMIAMLLDVAASSQGSLDILSAEIVSRATQNLAEVCTAPIAAENIVRLNRAYDFVVLLGDLTFSEHRAGLSAEELERISLARCHALRAISYITADSDLRDALYGMENFLPLAVQGITAMSETPSPLELEIAAHASAVLLNCSVDPMRQDALASGDSLVALLKGLSEGDPRIRLNSAQGIYNLALNVRIHDLLHHNNSIGRLLDIVNAAPESRAAATTQLQLQQQQQQQQQQALNQSSSTGALLGQVQAQPDRPKLASVTTSDVLVRRNAARTLALFVASPATARDVQLLIGTRPLLLALLPVLAMDKCHSLRASFNESLARSKRYGQRKRRQEAEKERKALEKAAQHKRDLEFEERLQHHLEEKIFTLNLSKRNLPISSDRMPGRAQERLYANLRAIAEYEKTAGSPALEGKALAEEERKRRAAKGKAGDDKDKAAREAAKAAEEKERLEKEKKEQEAAQAALASNAGPIRKRRNSLFENLEALEALRTAAAQAEGAKEAGNAALTAAEIEEANRKKAEEERIARELEEARIMEEKRLAIEEAERLAEEQATTRPVFDAVISSQEYYRALKDLAALAAAALGSAGGPAAAGVATAGAPLRRPGTAAHQKPAGAAAAGAAPATTTAVGDPVLFRNLYELGALEAALSALSSDQLPIRRASALLVKVLLSGGCGVNPATLTFEEDTLPVVLSTVHFVLAGIASEDPGLCSNSAECAKLLCEIAHPVRVELVALGAPRVLCGILRQLVEDCATRGAPLPADSPDRRLADDLVTLLLQLSMLPEGRRDLFDEGAMELMVDCARLPIHFHLDEVASFFMHMATHRQFGGVGGQRSVAPTGLAMVAQDSMAMRVEWLSRIVELRVMPAVLPLFSGTEVLGQVAVVELLRELAGSPAHLPYALSLITEQVLNVFISRLSCGDRTIVRGILLLINALISEESFRQRIYACGAVMSLLGCLRDPRVAPCSEAIVCLTSLSADAAFLKELTMLHGPSLLAQCLDSADEPTAVAATHFLTLVFRDPAVTKNVPSHNIVTRLIQISVKPETTHSHKQFGALSLLTTLCSSEPSCRAMMDEGIIACLLANTRALSLPIRKQALVCLASLAPSPHFSLHSHRAEVVESLFANYSVPDLGVVVESLAATAALAPRDEQAILMLLGLQFVPRLFRFLRHQDARVCFEASKVLAIATRYQPVALEVLAAQGGVAMIVQDTVSRDEGTRSAGIECVRGMSKIPACCQALVKEHVIAALLRVLQADESDANSAKILECLGDLVSLPQARAEILNLKGLQLILAKITRFPPANVVLFFLRLARSRDLVVNKVLGTLGTFPLLLNSAAQSKPASKRRILEVCSDLLEVPENKNIFVQAGGLQIIMGMAAIEDTSIRRQALQCLLNLAKSPTHISVVDSLPSIVTLALDTVDLRAADEVTHALAFDVLVHLSKFRPEPLLISITNSDGINKLIRYFRFGVSSSGNASNGGGGSRGAALRGGRQMLDGPSDDPLADGDEGDGDGDRDGDGEDDATADAGEVDEDHKVDVENQTLLSRTIMGTSTVAKLACLRLVGELCRHAPCREVILVGALMKPIVECFALSEAILLHNVAAFMSQVSKYQDSHGVLKWLGAVRELVGLLFKLSNAPIVRADTLTATFNALENLCTEAASRVALRNFKGMQAFMHWLSALSSGSAMSVLAWPKSVAVRKTDAFEAALLSALATACLDHDNSVAAGRLGAITLLVTFVKPTSAPATARHAIICLDHLSYTHANRARIISSGAAAAAMVYSQRLAAGKKAQGGPQKLAQPATPTSSSPVPGSPSPTPQQGGLDPIVRRHVVRLMRNLCLEEDSHSTLIDIGADAALREGMLLADPFTSRYAVQGLVHLLSTLPGCMQLQNDILKDDIIAVLIRHAREPVSQLVVNSEGLYAVPSGTNLGLARDTWRILSSITGIPVLCSSVTRARGLDIMSKGLLSADPAVRECAIISLCQWWVTTDATHLVPESVIATLTTASDLITNPLRLRYVTPAVLASLLRLLRVALLSQGPSVVFQKPTLVLGILQAAHVSVDAFAMGADPLLALGAQGVASASQPLGSTGEWTGVDIHFGSANRMRLAGGAARRRPGDKSGGGGGGGAQKPSNGVATSGPGVTDKVLNAALSDAVFLLHSSVASGLARVLELLDANLAPMISRCFKVGDARTTELALNFVAHCAGHSTAETAAKFRQRVIACDIMGLIAETVFVEDDVKRRATQVVDSLLNDMPLDSTLAAAPGVADVHRQPVVCKVLHRGEAWDDKEDLKEKF
jgi:hypothetical protein